MILFEIGAKIANKNYAVQCARYILQKKKLQKSP